MQYQLHFYNEGDFYNVQKMWLNIHALARHFAEKWISILL
jgi:hypothetical protein